MAKLSGGQRGSAAGMVLFGLAVAVVIAALSRGCDEQPAPPLVQAPLPPAPAAAPAVPPSAAAEPAPAALPAAAAPAGVAALLVHNPCDQPLLLAVNAADANGMRVSAGFFQVAPGARMTPASRNGPVFLYERTVHFYTETPATEPVETGRRDTTVADRQVGMKTVELDPPTSSTITLECPGATSGRP